MKPLTWNLLKVIAGYFAGLPLLWFIYPLPIWAIGLIQLLFFTLFYTMLDRIKANKELKEEEEFERLTEFYRHQHGD